MKLLAMPVKERNLLTMLRWAGVEPDLFPGEARLALLADFDVGFDHYTRGGCDFGDAACRTLDWMFGRTQ